MKTCPKCQKTKGLDEFYERKTGTRAGKQYEKCKECMKVRGRMYYHINRDRQLPLAIIRKQRAHKIKMEFINKIKNVPCSDCGGKFPPIVMDFDHRVSSDKVNNVATMMVKNWSLDNIRREIEKCDIVCSNCHRIRTFKKHAEIAKLVTAGL